MVDDPELDATGVATGDPKGALHSLDDRHGDTLPVATDRHQPGAPHASVIPLSPVPASGKICAHRNDRCEPGVNTTFPGCNPLPLQDWHLPIWATGAPENSAPVLNHALAAEGARLAADIAGTARRLRAQRLHDLLAGIEEWRRSTGPERAYARRNAAHDRAAFKRRYLAPERAAFEVAVAASQHRRTA